MSLCVKAPSRWTHGSDINVLTRTYPKTYLRKSQDSSVIIPTFLYKSTKPYTSCAVHLGGCSASPSGACHRVFRTRIIPLNERSQQWPTAASPKLLFSTLLQTTRNVSSEGLSLIDSHENGPLASSPAPIRHLTTVSTFERLTRTEQEENDVFDDGVLPFEGVSQMFAPNQIMSSNERDRNNTFHASTRNITAARSSAWRLPETFAREFSNLYRLTLEGKDATAIKSAYSPLVAAADNIFQLHNSSALGRLLNDTWDEQKALMVAQVILGSIIANPDRLLCILNIMGKLNSVSEDFHFRAGCLMLTGYIHGEILHRDDNLMELFDIEVDKLREPDKWPATGMFRRHLSLLLWRSSRTQTQKLVSDILTAYPHLEVSNTVCMAMSCAQQGLESLALTLLTTLPPERLQQPSRLTLKCCQVLLRNDMVEKTTDGHNFRFLPRLLEAGLTPDNVLYSRIIERALESGYSGVAWDIFHYLQSTNVDITEWTYLLLLRQAFNDNNVQGVQEIMSTIHQQRKLYTNPSLLLYSMNIVRRIFVKEKQMTTPESLSHILALYDRAFTRAPLFKLGILEAPEHSTCKDADESKSRAQLNIPDAVSLSFTIWAYVLCHRQAHHARWLWLRIKKLVDEGDATMVECMRHDLIYNAFMWLNARDEQTLAGSIEILQYMLSKQFCAPTDRTWSIIICGFLRHGQQSQAQRMFSMMKHYNLNISDIREEYWRRGWTLKYFKEHLLETLDENMMPDGTEFGEAAALRPAES